MFQLWDYLAFAPLAAPELTMQVSLVSSWFWAFCLCLLGAGLASMCYYYGTVESCPFLSLHATACMWKSGQLWSWCCSVLCWSRGLNKRHQASVTSTLPPLWTVSLAILFVFWDKVSQSLTVLALTVIQSSEFTKILSVSSVLGLQVCITIFWLHWSSLNVNFKIKKFNWYQEPFFFMFLLVCNLLLSLCVIKLFYGIWHPQSLVY